MKMRDEHYQMILDGFKEVKELQDTFEDDFDTVIKKMREDNRSEKRIRWDLFDAARINGNTINFICSYLYGYLNDNHIDSALKKAFKKITK